LQTQFVAVVLLLTSCCAAQTPAQPAPAAPAADLSPVLAQVEQMAQAATADIGRLRIDKWKTDSAGKEQSRANAQSLERNLSDALPGMVAQVRTSPQSLAAIFKLYRNLNALYDVLSALAESAGAFGPKADYDALAAHASSLDSLRRTMADYLESLAAARDAEIAGLRARAATAPPKKIVIDQNSPPKRSRKKKASNSK